MTAPNSVMGFVERRCAQCQREWQMERGECVCGSHELVEKFVAPTLLERVGGAIKAVVIPPPEKVQALAPADVAVLERTAIAARAFVEALREADAVARRAVNGSVGSRETIGHLQARLDSASSTLGDYSMQNLSISVALPALAVANLIDSTLRAHAEEVSK